MTLESGVGELEDHAQHPFYSDQTIDGRVWPERKTGGARAFLAIIGP